MGNTGERFCEARIWPSRADHWVRCGSLVLAHGRCAVYGHPDHGAWCIEGKCAFGYPTCMVAEGR